MADHSAKMRAVVAADVTGVYAQITQGWITPASVGEPPTEVEVMPVAVHEAVVAAAREVRAAFDAGKWPLGPSYKAVQDALRKLDDALGGA